MRTVLLLLGLLPTTARAATLTVGTGWPYATFQAALAAAQDGDVIELDGGTHTGPFTLTHDVTVLSQRGAVLVGTGVTVLTVQGADARLLDLDVRPNGGRGLSIVGGDVTLTRVTVSGNSGGTTALDGAGIDIQGATVVLDRAVFDDNEVRSRLFPSPRIDGAGGHLRITDSDVTITDSTFTAGAARLGAAIHASGTTSLVVADTTFDGGDASDSGGALYLTGAVTVRLEGCTFTSNHADRDGGAVLWTGSASTASFTATGTRFADNDADGLGGALRLDHAGTATLDGDTFARNRGDDGGGAGALSGLASLTVRGSSFCRDTTGGAGGALRVEDVDAATVTTSTFRRGAAGRDGGGAIACSGSTLTARHVDLLDSSATGSGGAVSAGACTLVLRDSLIAWTSAGRGVSTDRTADLDYNAWFANQPADTGGSATLGAGAVQGDPLMPRYRRNDDCDDDDLKRMPGSPLIDAADPTTTDPDGSRADIGALGGPDVAARLFTDADMDGTLAVYDCDDQRRAAAPGAVELCDGHDDDCDGTVDGPNPANATDFWPDPDGDGWGDASAEPTAACAAPSGYAAQGGDCDEANAAIHPDATEVCDHVDNDCSGDADGADAVGRLTWHPDADGDGRGASSGVSQVGCTGPEGWLLSADDCDDTDPTILPGAEERCDGKDRDCNGVVDSPDPVDGLTWYGDADNDGYGGDAYTTRTCVRPEGYGRAADDCNDGDATVHPGATEACEDGATDANCDGFTGTDDHDGDGFPACEDCDDGDATAFPGAAETWYDGKVADCTSLSDYDQDRDGYDSADHGGTDCDDLDPAVNPGAEETDDNTIDDDCDGVAAEPPGPFARQCDCATGASPTPGALLLLALAWRRRRSRPGDDRARDPRSDDAVW
ncbi:MAG: right-handed parallel beta-helix repeat-containing protein [Alphaproteobacteria bacterium]|nr:right-handed parallel beta-helix repeat-containing protein [Alphaproteobacteria bacterium]